ncbi:MAG: type VI secretion system baseplate subunit TssE [Polyangiaceae bacterium]
MASLLKKLENLAQPASSWNYTSRGGTDLENDITDHLVEILNTRMGSARTIPDYGLMEVSEVIHDFPDAIAMIQRSLKACIQQYEPRLKNVQVRHIKGEALTQMVLEFEITGQFQAPDGRRQSLRVGATMDGSGNVRVGG